MKSRMQKVNKKLQEAVFVSARFAISISVLLTSIFYILYSSPVVFGRDFIVRNATTSSPYFMVQGTTGSVGIGTTAPSSTLHVIGGGIFSQPVTVGTPVTSTQATTKSYVDSAIASASTQWTTTSTGIFYNSGNVGIGTVSPSAKLEVRGLGNNPSGLLYVGSISTNARGTLARMGFYSYWNMDSSGNTFWNWGARYDGEANQWVRAYTSADNYLPYTRYGTDGIVAFGGAVNNLTTDTNPTMSDKVVFNINSGSVGIGTTAPSSTLHVIGGGIFSQPVTVGTPTVSGHAATKSYVDSAVAVATSTQYWTASSTSIFYNSGNVGIGTTGPGATLDVLGVPSLIAIGNNGSGSNFKQPLFGMLQNSAETLNPTGNRFAVLYNSDMTANNWSPALGFGTNDGTNAALGAYISAQFKARSATNWTTSDLVFFTGTIGSQPSEKMRIANNGNVGIGTASPTAAKLTVAGTMRVDSGGGNLQVDSSGNTIIEL